jgi:hypothetical protein
MYQNNKTIKEVGHQRLGPFFIVKQINVVAFQLKLPGSMKMFSYTTLSTISPSNATLTKSPKPHQDHICLILFL